MLEPQEVCVAVFEWATNSSLPACALYASVQLGMDAALCSWACMQALFVFVCASVFPVGRALESFVVLLWLGRGGDYCSPASPANQFCLISHCTLSSTSPQQRGVTLSYCVCQQRKASRGGISLTGTTHTSLPPLSLSCQSVDRQSHYPTITFILFMFCYRCMLTQSDYKIYIQSRPTYKLYSSTVLLC